MEPGIEYSPTSTERALVKSLVSFGHSQRAISRYLDFHTDTLLKHFRRELDTGKIELGLKCAGRLFDCVLDTSAKDSDRNDAAKYILSRACGWYEKVHKDDSVDAMSAAIRESVRAVSDALSKEVKSDDKDVGSESSGNSK